MGSWNCFKINQYYVIHTTDLFFTFVPMFTRITATLLACLFLTGSTLLPLGDFSLLRDLPGMYKTYTTVVKEEPDVLDFIGDYLLHGKELFGHNKQDASPHNESGLQFQHQASSLNVLVYRLGFEPHHLPTVLKTYPLKRENIHTSDYQNELFRPPLV